MDRKQPNAIAILFFINVAANKTAINSGKIKGVNLLANIESIAVSSINKEMLTKKAKEELVSVKYINSMVENFHEADDL